MEKVIQRRAKSGKDEHSKKENKYTQAPEDFEETEVVEEEALEELEEKELFGGKKPKKKRPKKKMNKTIFWVIGILTFLILIFELLTIHRIMADQFNEEEFKRIIQVEQEDAKKYNENLTVKDETKGNVEVQELIPTDASGNPIEAIATQMDALKQEVLEKYAGATKKTLIFFKAYQTKIISNVNDIHYYVSVYQQKESGFEQLEFKELSHQLVFVDTLQPFEIAKLFNNELAVSNFFVKKALDEGKANGLSDEQTAKVTAQFMDGNWKKLDASIIQNGVRVKYKDASDQDAEWTIPFTELFAYMNENMIPETEKDNYEAYLATVKEKLGKKRIALSFDDGPRAETTPKVLEILKKYNAHATFYIVGSHVEGNESIVKQIVAEGHELGDHSYSHPLLTKKSADEVYQEVHKTSDLIAKASGGLRPMSLRPPYGGFNKMVSEQAGIAIVNWSIDSLDWKYRDAAKTIEHIKETAHNGGILLMHDIHEESVEALPAVIEYLQAEGYELVTVTELMADQPLKSNYVYFDRVENKPVQ